MASFHDRKAVGDAHELRVAQELTVRGWDVAAWGQAILTDVVSRALRGTDSSLRWTPDLIAAQEKRVVLVDCKGRMKSRDTGRHSVQRDAVMAHLQLTAWTRLPVIYVFDDLGVLTPMDILLSGRHGPHSPIGSGTAYYFIPAERSTPFDEVFGTARPAAPPLETVG
ncbi:hypothetical protein J1792_00390 [Streptomyces triculaminicus]|uniref:Uncharacterized protein n=2 Tax=Streptomyces TaxID=1883 RepID=A0A939JJT1_9ACTN|nr:MULTISPECIES: hypothetical protein [Streptomyces]MBO0651311.1 hypothetical protein [Streptomyces triculaminicus]QSY49634.1 hypothetical protein J3S04_00385 [Streptomyces griseocarneus]